MTTERCARSILHCMSVILEKSDRGRKILDCHPDEVVACVKLVYYICCKCVFLVSQLGSRESSSEDKGKAWGQVKCESEGIARYLKIGGDIDCLEERVKVMRKRISTHSPKEGYPMWDSVKKSLLETKDSSFKISQILARAMICLVQGNSLQRHLRKRNSNSEEFILFFKILALKILEHFHHNNDWDKFEDSTNSKGAVTRLYRTMLNQPDKAKEKWQEQYSQLDKNVFKDQEYPLPLDYIIYLFGHIAHQTSCITSFLEELGSNRLSKNPFLQGIPDEHGPLIRKTNCTKHNTISLPDQKNRKVHVKAGLRKRKLSDVFENDDVIEQTNTVDNWRDKFKTKAKEPSPLSKDAPSSIEKEGESRPTSVSEKETNSSDVTNEMMQKVDVAPEKEQSVDISWAIKLCEQLKSYNNKIEEEMGMDNACTATASDNESCSSSLLRERSYSCESASSCIGSSETLIGHYTEQKVPGLMDTLHEEKEVALLEKNVEWSATESKQIKNESLILWDVVSIDDIESDTEDQDCVITDYQPPKKRKYYKS